MYIQVHCSTCKIDKFKNNAGHSRKHPYHPHRGNWKLTPLPPSDVLIHLLLSETILSPLPSGRQKFPLWGECGFFLERPNKNAYHENIDFYNMTRMRHRHFGSSMNKNGRLKIMLPAKKLFVLLSVIFNLLLNFLGVSLSSRGY